MFKSKAGAILAWHGSCQLLQQLESCKYEAVIKRVLDVTRDVMREERVLSFMCPCCMGYRRMV